MATPSTAGMVRVCAGFTIRQGSSEVTPHAPWAAVVAIGSSCRIRYILSCSEGSLSISVRADLCRRILSFNLLVVEERMTMQRCSPGLHTPTKLTDTRVMYRYTSKYSQSMRQKLEKIDSYENQSAAPLKTWTPGRPGCPHSAKEPS